MLLFFLTSLFVCCSDFEAVWFGFRQVRKDWILSDVDKPSFRQRAQSLRHRLTLPAGEALERAVRHDSKATLTVPARGKAEDHQQDTELRVLELRHQAVKQQVGSLRPRDAGSRKCGFESWHKRVEVLNSDAGRPR